MVRTLSPGMGDAFTVVFGGTLVFFILLGDITPSRRSQARVWPDWTRRPRCRGPRRPRSRERAARRSRRVATRRRSCSWAARRRVLRPPLTSIGGRAPRVDSAAADPFVLIMLAVVGGLLIALILLGLLLPRLGGRPGRLAPDALARGRVPERARRRRADAGGDQRQAPGARRGRPDRGPRPRAGVRGPRDDAPARPRRGRVRALMVGGGCRGLELAAALVADGPRGAGRDAHEARRAAIEAVGARVLDRRPRPDRDAALRARERDDPALAARDRDRRRREVARAARLAAADDARADDRHDGARGASTRRRAPSRRTLLAAGPRGARAQTPTRSRSRCCEADPRGVDAWLAGARGAIARCWASARLRRDRAPDSGQARRGRRSSRSARIRAVAPQIEVLADDVGVGAERDAAAQQPPALVARAQVGAATARAPPRPRVADGVHSWPGSISPTNG